MHIASRTRAEKLDFSILSYSQLLGSPEVPGHCVVFKILSNKRTNSMWCLVKTLQKMAICGTATFRSHLPLRSHLQLFPPSLMANSIGSAVRSWVAAQCEPPLECIRRAGGRRNVTDVPACSARERQNTCVDLSGYHHLWPCTTCVCVTPTFPPAKIILKSQVPAVTVEHLKHFSKANTPSAAVPRASNEKHFGGGEM